MHKLLCASILTIVFISCDSNGDNDLALNFKLTYEGEPMIMFEDYTYPNSDLDFRVTRFSFYTSELTVSNGSESEVVLDVDYLDLTNSHSNLERATAGYEYTVDDIQLADYNQLNFNFGVTPEQNQTVPTDYNSSSPLSNLGEYWSGWESYVFIKIEGQIDFNNDGTYGSGENIVLHMGSDIVGRSIDMSASPNEENNIIINVDEVFNRDNVIYDIENFPTIHILNDATNRQLNILADNLVNAIEFE